MSRSIQVGFDGGGTRSRMIVRSSQGSLREIFPRSIKYTDLGIAESVRRFADMLRSLASPETWDTAQISISLSGASNEVANREFVASLKTAFADKEINCQIQSDSISSLNAAYPNNESGYLLIAGTGSVAMARDRAGNLHKAGGWGRLLGDEGSGYWIGLQALKYFVKQIDLGVTISASSTGNNTLFEAINSSLHPQTGGEFSVLRAKLYSNEIHPANLAPIVFEFQDDPPAQQILHEGAIALANLITVLRRKAEANIDPIITLHGSVCSQPVYTELISEALNDEYELRVLDEWAVAEYCLK
jgi:N-acetylglucosamine kinase-like BadF-type ATPase